MGTQHPLTYPIPNHKTNTGGVSHGHTAPTHISHTQPYNQHRWGEYTAFTHIPTSYPPHNQHRWGEYTGTQHSLTYPIPNHTTNTGEMSTWAYRTHSHSTVPSWRSFLKSFSVYVCPVHSCRMRTEGQWTTAMLGCFEVGAQQ